MILIVSMKSSAGNSSGVGWQPVVGMDLDEQAP